jgi:hypothetical protein
MFEGVVFSRFGRILFAEKRTGLVKGANIQAFCCKKCGYVEFYKEMKEGVKP